ncbi:DapH/DapD/GlmU-related protein [Tetrasphaera sp. F2B08]|uniref:acyltransferase n=1 Tax=Nostocoides sp. F2B08 TaxID=2653936 RepID=UPI001D0435B9
MLSEVRIGRNCWLGSNVVVSAGSIIGDGVVVAAQSFVSGELAPHTLYAGSPARPIREASMPPPSGSMGRLMSWE